MTHLPNPFTYPKPITLATLGDLFTHHRATTGGWSMDAGGDSGTDGGDAGAGGDAAAGGARYAPPATQADLDRIIGDRLAREREKFADYVDLKKKADAHDAALEAAKTESEKAVDAARKEGEQAAMSRANSRLVAAEARALAAEAKFASPSLAVRALDLTDVKVGDDGQPDAEAIKAKLKELADSGAFVIGDAKLGGRLRPDLSQGGDSGRRTGARMADLDGNELYDRMHPKKTA